MYVKAALQGTCALMLKAAIKNMAKRKIFAFIILFFLIKEYVCLNLRRHEFLHCEHY